MKKIMLEVGVPDDFYSIDPSFVINYASDFDCPSRLIEPAVQAQGEPVGEFSGVMMEWAEDYKPECGDKYYLHPVTSDRREAQKDSIDGSGRDERKGFNRLTIQDLYELYACDTMPFGEAKKVIKAFAAKNNLGNKQAHRAFATAKRMFDPTDPELRSFLDTTTPQSDAHVDKIKVKYIGANDDQVRWGGGDDPRELLTEGMVYELAREEVHSWHTKYYLTPFPKKAFNSVCFERCAG